MRLKKVVVYFSVLLMYLYLFEVRSHEKIQQGMPQYSHAAAAMLYLVLTLLYVFLGSLYACRVRARKPYRSFISIIVAYVSVYWVVQFNPLRFAGNKKLLVASALMFCLALIVKGAVIDAVWEKHYRSSPEFNDKMMDEKYLIPAFWLICLLAFVRSGVEFIR